MVDTDREHYAFGYPYILMPDLGSSAVTDALIEENYFPILPLAVGLTVGEDTGSAVVTQLLTTSEASYSKADGYAMETYDWEEGDAEGPFALAVSVEDDSGGQIVWFTSDQFLTDDYNALSSGANQDLVMNASAA